MNKMVYTHLSGQKELPGVICSCVVGCGAMTENESFFSSSIEYDEAVVGVLKLLLDVSFVYY